LIHSFLMEGQTELADPVFDAVRATIEHKRQRAVIGPWRMPDVMSKFIPIGLGLAAVVVVLVIGTQLLGPSASGGVGATPTAMPSPTAAPSLTAMPSPTAAPSAVAPSSAAGLPAGTSHPLWKQGVVITVTIPAPGWDGDPQAGILVKEDSGADPPDGAGMIVFDGPLYVYANPCQWSGTAPETPATTVDELVAALSAQASRDATEPVDITVDGYQGKSITLHVPDDATYAAGRFTDCDQGYFGSWTAGATLEPYRYHQGPGQIDELWILDVDGVLVVIDTAHYAGTPAEHVEELRAIVRSATFEAP
jgi:hypothetical protein